MIDFSELKLNGKEPVYIQITSFIKRMILLGNVICGDTLPSRRELAGMLEITPNTVQKAYKFMEEEGYIVTPQNAASVVYFDYNVFEKIETELTLGLVVDFVKSAKENNMSFKRVIELLTEVWDK